MTILRMVITDIIVNICHYCLCICFIENIAIIVIMKVIEIIQIIDLQVIAFI